MGICASAQSAQIATLLHDGIISNYYSGNAFVEALGAAEDGDVITLSSGIFNATDITKNVTVRGAGISVPEMSVTVTPTILTGNFKINCSSSETNPGTLTIEGIQHNETINLLATDNLNFMKCRFNSIYTNYSSDIKDISFLHCIITELDASGGTGSISFVNSVISTLFKSCGSTGAWTYDFTNCNVYTGSSINKCNMKNSIIIMEKGASAFPTEIPANCSITNCVVANCTKYQAANGGNKFWTGKNGIFTESGFYELSDDVKTFTGNDGTAVGIHGGSMPFDPYLSMPKITKFKVASKTTPDGKLSVDIEVKGVE